MSFWSILRQGVQSPVQGMVVINPETAAPVVPLTDAQMRESAVVVTAGQIVSVTTTIPINASISGDVDLGLMRLSRIVIPAGWTPANITLQTSYDGMDWSSTGLYDSSGSEYTITAAAARSIIVPLADMLSVRYLRIRSGSAAMPVPQTAARALVLVLVP